MGIPRVDSRADALVLGADKKGKLVDSGHDGDGVERRTSLRIGTQPRETVKQDVEREAALEPRQGGAKAEVDAAAEGKMVVGVAGRVEGVRLGERDFVPVG